MEANVLIPEELYITLRRHLFKENQEQGAFLFAKESASSNGTDLIVKDIHLIQTGAWDVQNSFYLELSEEEKVKIMLHARDRDFDLIECHSHRNNGPAAFSLSDIRGLKEFLGYVRWKLPGKKYGALVWTESSVHGQVWDLKNNLRFPIKKVCIIGKNKASWNLGVTTGIWRKFIKQLSNIIKRKNYAK